MEDGGKEDGGMEDGGMEDGRMEDGGKEEGNWRQNSSTIVNTTGSVLFAMADFLFFIRRLNS